MRFILGVDEAGYGPNYGPLVITTTVWTTPSRFRGDDLYAALAEAIVPPDHELAFGDERTTMGDSKAVYGGAGGLDFLERGVLAALAATGRRPKTWSELWSDVCPDDAADVAAEPCHAEFDVRLPIAARRADVRNDLARLKRVMTTARARLRSIHSRAIFPARFNQLVARHGNKAEALSSQTFALIGRTIENLPAGPVLVLADKHGGRNHYHALLQQAFPDWLIEVHGESAAQSCYRWGPAKRRVEAKFRPRSEAHLPVALASMVSKYLREMAMRAFNEFWRARVPDLRPTAGYPADARRFKQQIAAAQSALEIGDNLLWRER